MLYIQRGTPPNEAVEGNNNQPHIVWFQEESDDEDIMQQLFIAVEQTLMLETNNLVTAVYACLAAHYIFNLSYHPKSGDFWVFIQERVLDIPSDKYRKRYPSSTSHFTGIARMMKV